MKIVLYDKTTVKRDIVSVVANIGCVCMANINGLVAIVLFVIFNSFDMAIRIIGTNKKYEK